MQGGDNPSPLARARFLPEWVQSVAACPPPLHPS